MPCVIKENIFRLQIPINDIKAMQTFKCAEKLSSIEPRPIDIKSLFLLQMVEQFASVDESQHQIQLFRRLEREFQRYNEGVVDLGQYGPLGQSMCNL
jgi:hypothetical protein